MIETTFVMNLDSVKIVKNQIGVKFDFHWRIIGNEQQQRSRRSKKYNVADDKR